MHPRIIIERSARAYERITESALVISQAIGVPVPVALTATNRDKDLQALYRLEAVAEFLNGLVATLPDTDEPVTQADIEAAHELSGLVKKFDEGRAEHEAASLEIIRKIESASALVDEATIEQAEQLLRPKAKTGKSK